MTKIKSRLVQLGSVRQLTLGSTGSQNPELVIGGYYPAG